MKFKLLLLIHLIICGFIFAGYKYGFIDKTGNFKINPQFDHARDFHNGLAAVKKEKEWGYVNSKGEWIVNPQFDKARPFGTSRAMVKKGGEWGWIDNKGKYVINPQFPNAYPFVKLAW